jgi:hypothetical protein
MDMKTPPKSDAEFDQWLRDSLSAASPAQDLRDESDVATAVSVRARERRFRQRAVALYCAITAGVGIYVLAAAGVPLPLNLGVNAVALAVGAIGLTWLSRSGRLATPHSSARDDST